MKKSFGFNPRSCLLILLLICIFSAATFAQQTAIKDYVLFGGKENITNGAVILSSSTNVYGGTVGSFTLVSTTGNSAINGNVYSGGTITLSNGNTVNGKIAAANTASTTGKALLMGSNAVVNGNIDVKGNIEIVSGTVSGKVTHPPGTTYLGPLPGGGDIIGTPSLPVLPQLPPTLNFPPFKNVPTISSNTDLVPGEYGDIGLSGNKTITFQGPGVYVFNKIANNGGTNEFIFDFQNKVAGTFRLYIHGDAELAKIKVSTINGGGAGRIFTEVHGNGSTNSGNCFNIANGSSANAATKWLGTVWAPNASINVGSGTGNSNISGALWSGVNVKIQSGVNVEYVPYSECVLPEVNAGIDRPLNFANETSLTAVSPTPGVNFSWEALNGGVISTASNVASITVTAAGTYVVTAALNADCKATDTVLVAAKVKSLIGAELQSVYDNYGNNAPPSPFFLIQSDKIYIDIITLEGKYSSTLTLLTGPTYGLTNILSNGSSQYIITGLFPIANLPLLNALTSNISYVRPYYQAISKSGIVTTAGDTAMRSNLVRNGYDLSGAGVKVGVISNSFSTITSATTNPITNTALQDIANGDLPGPGNPDGNLTPVNVLKEFPFTSTDEGRAMLQIVHDVAPKAELFFRTGTISAGDFAKGITDLRDAGCNIIVDDVTFITEPFLKDGVIAAAVDQVAASGTTYFSAAGNFSNKSYENSYSPVAAPAGLAATAHNFGGGDRFQNVTLSPGNYTIVLQWLDDFYSLGQTATGGTKYDLDIYLTPNTDGTALFGFNRNNTNGDPIEILPFTINTTVNTNVLITNNTVAGNPARFKYIIFRGDIVFNEFSTGNSTIVGQANALGAIAVGAARYDKVAPFPGPLVVESFSSLGGTMIGSTVRNKPDFVSVDGVNTTVNMGPDYPAASPDGYSNFFGTSAAAPHAAAVAALVMEGKKKFSGVLNTSPAVIRAVFQAGATDMHTPGFDLLTGYGFVNADISMRSFAQPKPSISLLNIPAGANPGNQVFILNISGENFSSTSVVQFRGNPVPTTYVNTNTLTAEIPVFIGNPAITVYTPPVSSSGLDGGLSNSIDLLSIPKKQVTIITDNKTKKYAQQLPLLTATILVDGDSLKHTNYTIAELGLTPLTVTSSVTALSNAGSYIITAARVFDPTNANDVGYKEIYNYTFTQGTFTVEKLPVKVTAKNITAHYGQKIPDAQFTYEFDATGIPDAATFLASLKAGHAAQIAKDQAGNDILGLVNGQAVTIVNGQAIPIVNGQAVTIVNGQAVTIVNGQAVPIVNGQAITIVNGQAVTIVNNLTAADISGLNFLASEPSIGGSRLIPNNSLVNGVYQASNTQVVDVVQESILKYNVNSAQTSMLSAVSLVSGRGLVDEASYKEGQAITIVNGQAITIVNGQAITIVNGQAVTIVNGQAVTIVNGQAVPIVNSQGKTAVILSASEIGQGQSLLKSLNLITGLSVGNQFIIPGSFVNSNLQLSYVAGTVTITPAIVTITPIANQAKEYGAADPTFNFTNNAGLAASDFTGKLSRAAGENIGTYNYTIGTLNAGSNYSLQLGGTNSFSITARQVVITPVAGQSKIYGDADPVFAYSNNGGLAPASFTGLLGRASGSNAGLYTYTLGNLSAGSNIVLMLSTTADKFTILKAPLVVKAQDNYTYEGEPLPALTSEINTFKAGDVNPGVTYTISPNYTGNVGIYTITPKLNTFANSINYNISYVNGSFYVNPSGKKSRKLRAYLNCVEELPGNPGGFRYIAHFYCINDNRTTIYIPVGPDNLITASGAFDNSQQAYIFNPGTTTFSVPFDGSALTWQLTSYESTNKSSTSSNASSGSNKCNTVTLKSNSTGVTASLTDEAQVNLNSQISIFPNPVSQRATIKVTGTINNEKSVSVIDTYGRAMSVRMTRKMQDNELVLDVTALMPGTYFVRVKLEDGTKTIGFLKF